MTTHQIAHVEGSRDNGFATGLIDRYVARWRIAFAFLREPRRVLVVCVTIALGTIALMMADGFIQRTFLLFREDIIRSHFAHIQVVPRNADERIAGDTGREIRRLLNRELTAHRTSLVTARLSFAGLIAHGERTVGFLGEGIEPASEASLSKAVKISAGTPLEVAGSGRVLLGEGLARSIGASVGDSVTLLVNVPDTGGINAVELIVAGLFHTATKAYDDRSLRLPLDAAQQLLRSDSVSRFMVLLPATEQAPAAAQRLREALDARDVKVVIWSDLADFYSKTVSLFSRQLNFVRLIILVIVMLATFNSMARKVMEQQREIGTMMALGARRRRVAYKFVGEALIIGLLGGCIGVASGFLLATGISWVGIPMPPPPGNAHGFTGGVEFSIGIASTAFTTVLVVCVLASLAPALRASRVVIADALRAER